MVEIKELLKAGRIRRLAVKVSDTTRRYSYVPASKMLAGGVGFCTTEGCDGVPQLVVAGHKLCAQCARGPVDEKRGGGMFRTEAEEDKTMVEKAAQPGEHSQASGEWIPLHGE